LCNLFCFANFSGQFCCQKILFRVQGTFQQEYIITDPLEDILHSLLLNRENDIVIFSCRLIISAIAVILNFVRSSKNNLGNFVNVQNTPLVNFCSTFNPVENRKVKTAFGDYFSVPANASKIRFVTEDLEMKTASTATKTN